MNKFKLTSLLFFISLALFAQENNEPAKNEIKLNAVYLIAGIPEIGYEYFMNEESSLGIDLLFAIDDSDIRFATTPYYRLYFGKKPNTGFFAEGFGMLNISESYELLYFNNLDVVEESVNETDFALGVAIGGKFITTKGLTFEFYGGIGRNLFNENSIETVPRFGLTFGKRF